MKDLGAQIKRINNLLGSDAEKQRTQTDTEVWSRPPCFVYYEVPL